jgi:hypothetical protein
MREASRTALAMVRATTLPATFESTHRLPSCSNCLFTISIPTDNTYAPKCFMLNPTSTYPPTHPTPLASSLAMLQHNTTRHSTARRERRRLLTLPNLPNPRLQPFLSSHPHPYHPHLKPSTLASLIPLKPHTHAVSTPQHRQPAARHGTSGSGKGAAWRLQSDAARQRGSHASRVCGAGDVDRDADTDTKHEDGDQDRQFRRLRHTSYNDRTVWL